MIDLLNKAFYLRELDTVLYCYGRTTDRPWRFTFQVVTSGVLDGFASYLETDPELLALVLEAQLGGALVAMLDHVNL